MHGAGVVEQYRRCVPLHGAGDAGALYCVVCVLWFVVCVFYAVVHVLVRCACVVSLCVMWGRLV